MGVDESDVRGKEYGEAIRTDALLLATFNKDSKTVKLLSIPRDTYTYIPIEKKKIKLHTLMHSVLLKRKNGGPQASIDAVEKLMNVPVDYFVKFNFKSFIKSSMTWAVLKLMYQLNLLSKIAMIMLRLFT